MANYAIVVTKDRVYTFHSQREGKDLTLDDIKERWEKGFGDGSFDDSVIEVHFHEGMHRDWEQE